ncbi:MAG: GlxA family transcriptional regulator [Hyphomicrobiaceae bacterium]
MRSPFEPHARAESFALDIVLLPSFSLLSLAMTMEPLRAANRVAGEALYRWRLVSVDGCPVATSSGIALPVDAAFGDGAAADALIVVASFDVVRTARPLLPGLRKLGRRGLPMGGVEAGSWVLAMAGLLDGRRATTHWEDLEEFARAFPRVDVVPDRFVVDRDRFTTGGAAPALDMVLDLIRAQHGMSLALDVASVFVYDEARPAAEPQRVVQMGHLALAEPRLAAAIRLMEERLSPTLPIEEIAASVGVGRRSLEMLFRRHLGLGPGGYYLDLRLNAARRMLSHPGHSVADIADATGFGSASAFARAFRSRFGESPTRAQCSATGSRSGTGRPGAGPDAGRRDEAEGPVRTPASGLRARPVR